MEHAFAELPLALFTAFSSMGAGAFVLLAVAQLTCSLEGVAGRKLYRAMTLPVVLVLVGFVSAFFHLASPLHAFGVFAGIGASPLSNELVAGCLFFVVALVHWVLGLAGRLPVSAQKAFAIVVAALALVFAAFMGLAYMMPTIPTWSSPLSVLGMVGAALVGGTAVGLATLVLAGFDVPKAPVSFKAIAAVLAVAGAVCAIVALFAQAGQAESMANALVAGSQLVAESSTTRMIALVALVVSAVCSAAASFGKGAMALSWCGVSAAFAGILAARLCFYALQLSVGPVL